MAVESNNDFITLGLQASNTLIVKKGFALSSQEYSILRMVNVDVSYLGSLRTEAMHAPSKSVICTDAPVDNCGQGQLFSPTDLVGAALGTCVLTILGIYAQKHSLDVSGASASVQKEMTATPVRRISRLETTIRIPLPKQNQHREAIERAAPYTHHSFQKSKNRLRSCGENETLEE